MCRKIVWFYFSALIILEFSLQSKLSAHEHSDDVTQNALVPEEVSIQDCPSCSSGWVVAEPAALSLGVVPLCSARAARVSLHNRADSTVHLASVAGTTPDFHASFFHSKSIPRGGNTSFSVVFVARGEGPAAAELFLHTSRGLHKYPVWALGAPSPWCIRPAGGLRVAHNVSTELQLALCNPTDETLQIVEAFSSAPWCGVEVGGAWTLGPHSQPPSPPLKLNLRHEYDPQTAFLRIKFNNSLVGSLTVRVDVSTTRGVTLPSHVDLGTRGSHDEPHVETLSGANPLGVGVRVEPRACALSCGPDTVQHGSSGVTVNGCSSATGNGDSMGNGDSTGNGDNTASSHGGVVLRTLTDTVAPHALYKPIAELHFNWTALWETARRSAACPACVVRCVGAVRVAAQSVHYSVRMLHGTLVAQPAHAHLVSSECATAGVASGWGELSVRNTFASPIHVMNVVYPHTAYKYFTMSKFTPAVVPAGAAWRGPRADVRAHVCGHTYSAHVVLVTNVTHYRVPLALYTPAVEWEFDWIGFSEGRLDVGGVPRGDSRRIEGFLSTTAPADQHILDVTTDPPDVQLLFDKQQLVVPARSSVPVTLVVPCPERAGAVSGSVTVRTRHVTVELKLSYERVDGDVHLHNVVLQGLVGSVELQADNSLGSPLVLRGLAVRGDLPYDLYCTATCELESGSLETVTFPVARTRHGAVPAPSAPCRSVAPPRLSYLHHATHDPRSDCAEEPATSLERDAARLWARVAAPSQGYNFTVHMYTSQLLQVSASGWASPDWTRLASPLSDLGGAALGQSVSSIVSVSNPGAAWPLWLQPVLSRYHPLPHVAFSSSLPSEKARAASLEDFAAFSVSVSGAVPGAVPGDLPGDVPCAGAVVVPPGASVLLNVTFVPTRVGDYHAFLYLRNNMSGVEAWCVRARGVAARVSLRGSGALRGGRGACGGARGEVVARNEAAAPLRAGYPLVAGVPCAARGFSVTPCPHPPLQPQQVVVYRVEYSGEWSVAHPRAWLQVPHAAPVELSAHVPPGACEPAGGAGEPRCAGPGACAPAEPACEPQCGPGPLPPFPRVPALMLAVLAAAAAVTAAACQAEAVLKRAVACMRERDPTLPHLPSTHLLDLRALARTTIHAHAPTPPPAVLHQPRADTQHNTHAHTPRGDSVLTQRGDSLHMPRVDSVHTPRVDSVHTPRVDSVHMPRIDSVHTPRVDSVQTQRGDNVQTPRVESVHNAAHALNATASSLARHKRKVKKILAEIKSDLAKTRPALNKSPNYSDDLDTQLLEDDVSRSSNEESGGTNADETHDKNDFFDKFDGGREKFDSHDDFDSRYKYDKHHEKSDQSTKYTTQHYKDKSDTHPYKPRTPTEKPDKYDTKEKSRYDKPEVTERYRDSSDKSWSPAGVDKGRAPPPPPPPPPPSSVPDDDNESSGTDSSHSEPRGTDSPPARHGKRDGVGASDTATGVGGGRRRERGSKRDNTTPPKPHERLRHVRPKARVVSRRRSPPASPLDPTPPPAPSPDPAPAPAPTHAHAPDYCPPAAPIVPPAPPAPLRATFSEIVSSGAPPPPRPLPATPPPPAPRDTHDSLFYYGGMRGSSWNQSASHSPALQLPPAPMAPPPSLPAAPLPTALPAPVAPPTPESLRSDIFTHAQDRHSAYNDASVGVGGGAASSAAWWAAGWRAVRPPPGFLPAPARAAHAAHPARPRTAAEGVARTFDPLNALAGVWEGGVWRDQRDPRT